MSRQLRISRFSFVCRFVTPATLPLYKGFALRGAFGSAFRRVCCVMNKRQSCEDCFLNQECAYFNVFETISLKSSRGKDIPRAFVLEPPYDTNRIYLEGDTIVFNLVLFGGSIVYLPFFVMTFVEMGKRGIGIPSKRGKFIVKQVLDLGGKTLFSEGNNLLLNRPTLYSSSLFPLNNPRETSAVKVKILSPIRSKKGGKYVGPKDFSLEIFVDIIRRRLLLLNEFYSLFPTEILDRVESLLSCELTHTCLSWKELERYSVRQKVRMKMGGIFGEFILKLPHDVHKKKEIWKILKLSELIHIGKNTTFGLGKVEVESAL